MYTFDVLETKRSVMDQPVDDFVENYISSGDRSKTGVRIGNLFSGRIFQDTDGEALKQNFLKLPKWTDFDRIRKGQKLFSRFGPEISMLLMFKSLPECYACGNGVNVLFQTGKFSYKKNKKAFTKRLLDTAQFVQAVLTEGSFEGEKSGLKALLKTRVIHATARCLLKRKGDWDLYKYGAPINQEDMLGTLMAFSISVVEGLIKLGVKLTTQEIEDFYYVWRVSGHLLGVEKGLVPINAEEAFELSSCIMCHQLGGSKEGEVLLKSIIHFVNDNLMLSWLDGGGEELIRFFVDEKVSEEIGVATNGNKLPMLIPVLIRSLVHLRHNLFFSPNYIRMVSYWNVILLNYTVIYFTFIGRDKN